MKRIPSPAHFALLLLPAACLVLIFFSTGCARYRLLEYSEVTAGITEQSAETLIRTMLLEQPVRNPPVSATVDAEAMRFRDTRGVERSFYWTTPDALKLYRHRSGKFCIALEKNGRIILRIFTYDESRAKSFINSFYFMREAAERKVKT